MTRFALAEKRSRRVGLSVLSATLFLPPTACIPDLPENLGAQPPIERTLVTAADAARVYRETGLTDGVWMEIDGSDAGIVVGGYLSTPPDELATTSLIDGPPGLALILAGASTFYDEGALAKAREYHDDFAAELRSVGLRTWTLVVRECGTAYNEGDLADTLAVIDWLDAGGRDVLGVERLYLVGYSAGATVAYRVQRERRLDPVVAIDGLAGTTLFETLWPLDKLVADLYPQNTGICQFASTLDAYGRPPSPAWQAFDAASYLEHMLNPMLVIHGTFDIIFPFEDALHFRDEYVAALERGADVPPVEFAFIPRAGHINVSQRPDIRAAMKDYLRRVEDAALGE